MDKEKSKSNRSSLSYIKWCYGLDKEEQREIRFKEKFGNIREEEVRTECEAIRFLKEELLIDELTDDPPNFHEGIGDNF